MADMVAATVARKMQAMEKAVTAGQKPALIKAAVAAKTAINSSTAGDVGGDLSMSGWTRRRPIKIGTRFDPLPGNDAAVMVWPEKRARGPMKVLEVGRNKGETGMFAGPSINRTTGLTSFTKSGSVRKSRGQRAKRWNGYTAGKSTWSNGVKRAARDVPKRYMPEATRIVVSAFRS